MRNQMKTKETNATSDEASFDALTRSYAYIPEPEGRRWIVKRDDKGLYLPAYGTDESRNVLIEWTAIDEPMKALQIARQLSHKRWMTREMAADFLDLVFERFGWAKGLSHL